MAQTTKETLLRIRQELADVYLSETDDRVLAQIDHATLHLIGACAVLEGLAEVPNA